jgi:hypothetical protein
MESAPPTGVGEDSEQTLPRYRMLLPPGWERFSLSTDPLPKVRRLVAERTERFPPNIARELRAELEQELQRRIWQAREKDCVELLLLVRPIRDMPVDASCLLTNLPAPPVDEAMPATDLATVFGATGLDAMVFGPPGGQGVKVRESVPPTSNDELSTGRPSRIFFYYVPVPDSNRYALLTFSTSSDQIFVALEALFDAMVASFEWL